MQSYHSSVSLLLAEAASPESASRFDSLYFILFLAVAFAAVVWLILWLLSRSDEESDGESGDAVGEESAAPAKGADSSAGASTTSESEEAPDIDTASEEQAAGMFSEELSSGQVTQDPVYGIIYKETPDEVDDLKRIKGVAKVLEGKLNDIGVYHFKQVAVWTDAACAEFSKLLTFKDRIYRDNWIEQAKTLHEEKYGEEL